MASAKKIKVTLANLSEPLKILHIVSGTTIEKFLEDNGLTFNSSVRVNAGVVPQRYRLKKNDIVCMVTKINAGK